MSDVRVIRVFIASPSDLAVERRAFKEAIDELNVGFGDGAGVRFEALTWEQTLAIMTRRSQGLINQELDRCDVFVLALYGRWGQAAADALPYSSYTEEEFHRALDRWKKTGSPEIFVFFKHVTPREMGDPGEQLKKVLAFRQSLEDSRQVLHRFFADEQEFKVEVSRHLRAFAKGELPKADAPLDGVLLPLHAIEEVQKAKAEAQQHKDRAEELALVLAEQAAMAALEGRVEQARQIFAKAHQGTTNFRVLSLAYEFYDRMGNLASAEEMLERCLAISGPDVEVHETADTLVNLGSIVFKRGYYDRAQEHWKKARSLFAEIGMLDRAQQVQQFLDSLEPTAGTLSEGDWDAAPCGDGATIVGDEPVYITLDGVPMR